MLDDNKVVIAHNAQRTSIAAAQKILPKTGSLRRKVYEYILNQGLRGATDQEMETTLNTGGKPSTKLPPRILGKLQAVAKEAIQITHH